MHRFLITLSLMYSVACSGKLDRPTQQAAYDTDVRSRVVWVAATILDTNNSSSGMLWQDSFDTEASLDSYFEASGNVSTAVRMGPTGGSFEQRYALGSHGDGNLKFVFGDAPFGRPPYSSQRFDDIYWRYYVYHPENWRGAPAEKWSRAIVFDSATWNQAAVLHVWDGDTGLTLDPVRGVAGQQIVTRRYNDFERFTWLGNEPEAVFPFYGAEVARWVCVEVRFRLNDPGIANGVASLWIDGVLSVHRTQLDFRGAYSERGINAIFLEAYLNEPSQLDRLRYLDNFVVSTKPIGPITSSPNPSILLGAQKRIGLFDVEIRNMRDELTVWRSQPINSVHLTVSAENGSFSDAGQQALRPGLYQIRVRQRDSGLQIERWSPWHQAFRVSN